MTHDSRLTTLSLSHISKRFDSVLALDDVSFDVQAGQVHALVGENGAGKTTLMRIAYGMIQPDTGEILVSSQDSRLTTHDSRPTVLPSPSQARAHGIGMVHQHFTSIPALTVGENIALSAGWPESGRRAERRAAEVITRLGLPLDASARVETLSAQLRQRLEVVRALAADPRILLLDEPSAVLAPREVAELLRLMKEFAATGGAVVLITHKLDEVFAAADRVTVLRRGKVVQEGPLARETPKSLAQAMIGADIPRTVKVERAVGEVAVRATALSLATDRQTTVSDATFEVRSGEIVGVAGIEGNGQREMLRAVAGLAEVRTVGGALTVQGSVAFVPEDRTTEGMIGEFTLTENLLLGQLNGAGHWLDWNALSSRTADLLSAFDVRAPGAAVKAETLSGGNQQKLIFARALDGAPRVLVAEDPTRGLDLLATEAIHERLRTAAKSGVAVLVHSSDLDEVLALADRVLVVANGEVREYPASTSREVIGDAMLGLVTR